jgi:hypothetical protein
MHHTATYTQICQMTVAGRGPRRAPKTPDLAAHLESIGWDLVLGAQNRDPQTFAKGLREARELAAREGGARG